MRNGLALRQQARQACRRLTEHAGQGAHTFDCTRALSWARMPSAAAAGGRVACHENKASGHANRRTRAEHAPVQWKCSKKGKRLPALSKGVHPIAQDVQEALQNYLMSAVMQTRSMLQTKTNREACSPGTPPQTHVAMRTQKGAATRQRPRRPLDARDDPQTQYTWSCMGRQPRATLVMRWS